MNRQENLLNKMKVKYVDFRDVQILSKFVNPSGRILSRRQTGCTAKNQRKVQKAIKRSRYMGFMPYINH